jgi:hypothetical protein
MLSHSVWNAGNALEERIAQSLHGPGSIRFLRIHEPGTQRIDASVPSHDGTERAAQPQGVALVECAVNEPLQAFGPAALRYSPDELERPVPHALAELFELAKHDVPAAPRKERSKDADDLLIARIVEAVENRNGIPIDELAALEAFDNGIEISPERAA